MKRMVLVEREALERLLRLARYSKVPFDASGSWCDTQRMESVNLPSGDHLPTAATTDSWQPDEEMKEPPMK